MRTALARTLVGFDAAPRVHLSAARPSDVAA